MKIRLLTSLVLATITPWICWSQTSDAPPSGLAPDDSQPTASSTPSPGAKPQEIGPFVQRLISLYASGDRSSVIASILKEHTPLARSTDPWGLRASGEIKHTKTVAAVEAAPQPTDKFDDAVAALKVPIVAFNEGWALVNGVELYVGDTLVISYQGTEVRATLSSLSPTQLVFQSPDGRSHVRTIERPDLESLGRREVPEDRGNDFKSFKGVSREVGQPDRK